MNLNEVREQIYIYFSGFSKATADTFAWLSILVLNAATVPTLVSVMSGNSNKMPPLDIVLLIWTGLLLYFIRSVIIKDMLMTVTIGLGFAIQAILLGFIFFV